MMTSGLWFGVSFHILKVSDIFLFNITLQQPFSGQDTSPAPQIAFLSRFSSDRILDFYGIGQLHPKILTKKFQFIFARTPNGVREGRCRIHHPRVSLRSDPGLPSPADLKE